MAEGQKQSQKQNVHCGKQHSRSRTWHGRRKDNIERLKNAPRYQFTGSQKHGGRKDGTQTSRRSIPAALDLVLHKQGGVSTALALAAIREAG